MTGMALAVLTHMIALTWLLWSNPKTGVILSRYWAIPALNLKKRAFHILYFTVKPPNSISLTGVLFIFSRWWKWSKYYCLWYWRPITHTRQTDRSCKLPTPHINSSREPQTWPSSLSHGHSTTEQFCLLLPSPDLLSHPVIRAPGRPTSSAASLSHDLQTSGQCQAALAQRPNDIPTSRQSTSTCQSEDTEEQPTSERHVGWSASK